jgi:nucleoid DNA-binding protein
MNKPELIDEISSKTGLTKIKSAEAIDAFVETITESLKNGESVLLVGFGMFKPNQKQARTGRNPKTGAEIKIEAKKSVSFSAGKSLKASLNSAE